MGFKKCGYCGITNKKAKVTVFDLTQRERIENDHNFDYLCQHHFSENDITVYADGRKR